MKKFNLLLILFSTLLIISCSKGDEPNEPVILSSENTITSFKLNINGEIVAGTIDQTAKTISFNTEGANLNSLTPDVQYSNKARLSPAQSVSQNFNNEIIYTVFAENGNPNVYRVIVNNRPFETENKILSFSVDVNNETLDATINHDKMLISFNSGSFDITTLSPSITISERANISPENNSQQNFESPIVYNVTAENGDTAAYIVMANMPEIANNTNNLNTQSYYTRASFYISGSFLNPNLSGAELYLFDGTNEYPLPIVRSENYDSNEYTTIYNLFTQIPENIPTSNNYKIAFRTDNSVTESEFLIDIVAENAPKFSSLNQTSYSFNDVLVINGENLTDTIIIPSNGSHFIINSSNYDYILNDDKTQISLILDYYYLFPAYFGDPPSEKTITFRGPDGRIGESFTTIFN